MDNKTLDKKRLRDELIRGRDSTKKLQNLLRRKVSDVGSVSIDDLVMIIGRSFSEGISMLGSCDSGEFRQIPASSHVGLASSADRTFGKNGKNLAPAVKDRRGSYKRRKTTDSRMKVAGTIEDGYAWRKYGQKAIQNAKFPRCYFRCRHQKTLGCKALKQVQKMEDGSKMFQIMYVGQHTCQNLNTTTNAPFVLNFEDSKNHHDLPNSPSTFTSIHFTPSVKQEYDSKGQSDNVSSAQSSSPALWTEIVIGDLDTGHEGASIMGFDFDHEDSCASISSPSYLDIDIFKNVGLMSDFQFFETMFS